MVPVDPREVLRPKRLEEAYLRHNLMTDVLQFAPHLIPTFNLKCPIDVLLEAVSGSATSLNTLLRPDPQYTL